MCRLQDAPLHPPSELISMQGQMDDQNNDQCRRGTGVRGVIKQLRGRVGVYVVKQTSESYDQMFVKKATVRRQLTNEDICVWAAKICAYLVSV